MISIYCSCFMFHVPCAIQMEKKNKQTFNENDNDCEMPGFLFARAPPCRPANTNSKMEHFGREKKNIKKSMNFIIYAFHHLWNTFCRFNSFLDYRFDRLAYWINFHHTQNYLLYIFCFVLFCFVLFLFPFRQTSFISCTNRVSVCMCVGLYVYNSV